MLKIAIVENEPEQADLLSGYIARYSQESGIKCQVVTFSNGLEFISGYTPGFDAVFMDIKMPLIDGMEAAEKLRKIDEDVVLIFVTNMAQLAIKGYKVNAMDFIVKPVTYFDFSLEMDKICRAHDRRTQDYVWVKTAGGAQTNRLQCHILYRNNYARCVRAYRPRDGKFPRLAEKSGRKVGPCSVFALQ